MKTSTKIFICLTVLWMVFIFVFSSQSASSSTITSNKITQIVIDIIEPENKNNKTADTQNNTGTNDNQDEKSETVPPKPQKEWFGIHRNNFSQFIRKIAHFMMFSILGMLSCCTGLCEFGKTKLKPLLKCTAIASSICILYAIFDEIHQLFIEGRSAEFRDVLIDFGGSYSGILMCIRVYLIFKSLHKNQNSKGNLQ